VRGVSATAAECVVEHPTSCTRTASSANRSCRPSRSSRAASSSRISTRTQARRPCSTRLIDADYRKLPRALSKVYYDPIDHANTVEFDKLFEAQTGDEHVREDGYVEVWGRRLHVPRSTAKVAEFTFDKLCNSPLSAADYIELTRKFDTIFVRDIPQLTLSERDQARRFILFIDACYESKVRGADVPGADGPQTKLFTLSEVPIMQIFSDKKKSDGEITPHMRATMDDLVRPILTPAALTRPGHLGGRGRRKLALHRRGRDLQLRPRRGASKAGSLGH